MTALNFTLSADAVVVLTDTLMTKENDEPAAFVSKALPIAHLNALISGRGLSDMVVGWAFDVACRRLVADFDDLILQSPAGLAERWAEVAHIDPPSTTVFIWGWSPAEGRFVGYAFRSGDGFKAERLGDGSRFAPGCDAATFDAITTHPDLGDVTKLAKVMLAAKEDEDASPAPRHERCHIGGEIVMHSLTLTEGGGVQVASQVVHHFADRDQQYAQAARLLEAQK